MIYELELNSEWYASYGEYDRAMRELTYLEGVGANARLAKDVDGTKYYLERR